MTFEIERLRDEYMQFQSEVGGFNPVTKEVTPLRYVVGFSFEHYLSSITGALESGLVYMY